MISLSKQFLRILLLNSNYYPSFFVSINKYLKWAWHCVDIL